MLTITDPVKIKAAAAYNAAADHFDDEALGVWAKYGRRTVERLALPSGASDRSDIVRTYPREIGGAQSFCHCRFHLSRPT